MCSTVAGASLPKTRANSGPLIGQEFDVRNMGHCLTEVPDVGNGLKNDLERRIDRAVGVDGLHAVMSPCLHLRVAGQAELAKMPNLS